MLVFVTLVALRAQLWGAILWDRSHWVYGNLQLAINILTNRFISLDN